ncbi:MAG: hypothetical protein RLZZ253_508 [Verrucomicrobiota bacterium]|jgi:hypothetical protein
MKLSPPLRRSVLLALVLLAGCGKKEEELSFEEVPAPPVAEEPAPVVAPAAPRETGAGTASDRAPDVAGKPSVATEPVPQPAGPDGKPEAKGDGLDGVPQKLLATDRAYEAWFKRHGLDLNDPQMLDQDPDGDGFSNRDEFLADTDPKDGKSRPGIHRTLRLKEYREVRVPLMLEEVKGENARIRLLEEGEGKSQTVSVGKEILGMRVEKVVYEMDSDKNGQPVDRSWVELLDAEKKGRVVLVKDVSARSEASTAVLVASDGEELAVRQGEVFEWPAQSGARYRVVDLRAQQAVVREVEAGRMWTIPPQ